MRLARSIPYRADCYLPFFVAALLLPAHAKVSLADPPLPAFVPTIYNVAIANSAINGGVPATTASSDNATAINAYITYCNAHGGGTVEIPAGTYISGQVNLKTNVNLKLDSGAVLRDININTTLINCTSGANMEISGSGIIDGGATTAVSTTNLVNLRNINTLAIIGVSIENAAHEHLVPVGDANVTISGVTIADPGTLAANGGKYLANTDGIDYAGTNFLIKNCNVSDGDDDIVAKPASTACANITITGCTIGAGHGISVGGGIGAGVSNMVVTNCTMNGTDNGFRVKASDMPATSGDAGGGTAHPLKNVIVKNIIMTNVKNPIIVDSFYDNGSNNFPTSPTSSTSYSYSSATPLAPDSTTPIWQNIAFENITATGASNAGQIYGLNVTTNGTTPNSMNGIAFSNVNISASSHMNMWYGANIDATGLSITVPRSDSFVNASPVKGASLSNLTNLITSGPKLLPGDFNRDGQVTSADVAAMTAALDNLTGFQSSHSLSNVQMEVIGDLNTDFQIDNADLQLLVAAVPEPSALVLAIVGLASLAALSRRRRSVL